MAGFNGIEALWLNRWILGNFLKKRNESIDEGCSLSHMREFLATEFCTPAISDLTPELCADYGVQHYDLINCTDIERVRRYMGFTSKSTLPFHSRFHV